MVLPKSGVLFRHGPAYAPGQVFLEVRVLIMLYLVAQGRVPLSPPLKFMRPAQGKVLAKDLTWIGGLAIVIHSLQIHGQQHMHVRIQMIDEVTLIFPFPDVWQVLRAGVRLVNDLDVKGLQFGMTYKLAAQIRPEPGPLPFGTAGRMNPHETAP